jgi:hypothetical protein
VSDLRPTSFPSDGQAGFPILALVADLIFRAKISATALAVGVKVDFVTRVGDLTGRTGRLLLVDLGLPGAAGAAGSWAAETGRPAVGFVSHVDVAAAQAAREAGVTLVLARSAFVARLANLLVHGGRAEEAPAGPREPEESA